MLILGSNERTEKKKQNMKGSLSLSKHFTQSVGKGWVCSKMTGSTEQAVETERVNLAVLGTDVPNIGARITMSPAAAEWLPGLSLCPSVRCSLRSPGCVLGRGGCRGWEVPLCRAAGTPTGTCGEVQHNNLHLHDAALNPFLYSSIGASAAPLLILNIV